MHSSETWAGGRWLAIDRGAIPDEPPRAAPAEAGGPSPTVPLFPLPEIARIDWQSLSLLTRVRITA
jgi:hypothetical protein